MKTKNDLEGLHMELYGKPPGATKARYEADPIKIATAPLIVREMIQVARPNSHLDIGCGTGIYVEEFRKQGVDSIGVEGNLAVKPILKTDPKMILFHDLRSPLSFEGKFDLVTCVEVVEHIAEQYVEVLVYNLTQYCRNWLIITSGTNSHGQNPWHLNEKPPDYWIKRIEAKGLHYQPWISRRLRRLYRERLKGKGLSWFGTCLLVFSRKRFKPSRRVRLAVMSSFIAKPIKKIRNSFRLEHDIRSRKKQEKATLAQDSSGDYSEIWSKYGQGQVKLDGRLDYKIGILKGQAKEFEMYIHACQELDVRYAVIDLTANSWLEEIGLADCDAFLARPPHWISVWRNMYIERVQILVSTLGKVIFPSLHEILLYENKRMMAYWLKANSVPHPRTDIFCDKSEALIFARLAKYPIVYKTTIGSAGSGIRILRNFSEAENLITEAFEKGVVRDPGDKRDKQWGYVLFQEYIPNAREFRIIRIGDSYFGHEKLKKNGMHSGSMLVRWGPPPRDCLDMCFEISEKGNFRSMDFDVLMTEDGRFLVSELQCVFGSYNPSQMYIDDTPGRYRRIGNDWVFEEGLFCRNGCANLRLVEFLKMLNSSERDRTL